MTIMILTEKKSYYGHETSKQLILKNLWKLNLSDNKKSETILANIKDLFSKISFPETLGTDNGPEFSYKKIKKYLDENNVKLIHGKAYNQRLQGCKKI